MLGPNTQNPKVIESKPGSKPNAKDDLNSLPMPELRAFAKNVWIADGPNVRDFGVMFTTRMIVVKLADGSVWVNSPVSVPFDTLKRIIELGPVRYLIVATPRHVWRLDGWHTLFPEAQLWAPRTTPFTLKKGRLPSTGILSDAPSHDWADDFDQLAFKGSPLIEEVLFFHKDSRTVILDDLIQNQYLFTVNTGNSSISRYRIHADGTLTLLGSTPFKNPTGLRPFDARLSPNGNYLYVVDAGLDAVSVFAVDGGNLTELSASPVALPAGATPFGIVVTANHENEHDD